MFFFWKVIVGGEIYLLVLGLDEVVGVLGFCKVWVNFLVVLGLSIRFLVGLGIIIVVLIFLVMVKLGFKVIVRLREKINRCMVIFLS